MGLRELERQMYVNNMQLNSIRAAYKRVDPFSEEFERLLEKDLELQDEQGRLLRQRPKAVQEFYGWP